MKVKQILNNVDHYFQSGQLDYALNECELAIQMAPDMAIPYNYRGLVYDELGQPENALADFQTAIRLDPGFEDALDNIESIEKEIEEEFQHSDSKYHLDLALDYIYNDEPENALDECEIARSIMPNIAVAHNSLGTVLQAMDLLKSAIESYQNAINLNPRFYAARENLGNALCLLEEEYYRDVAMGNEFDMQEEYETALEPEDDQLINTDEYENPVPGWIYTDEKAFLLTGWPGHRTRQGQSGYDPLDTDFENAHMTGVIFRSLIDRKFRTRNPIYLMLMSFVGLLCCIPLLGIMSILQCQWPLVLPLILFSPCWIVGLALLINVFLSLILEQSDEFDEDGRVFF